MRNILFVCSKNQWRSTTAEAIYSNDPRFNVRSAGTSDKAKRTVLVNDIVWAEDIFVMEKRHKKILTRRFSHDLSGKNIVVLDIPDEYQYMDEELIELLRDGVERHL